MWPAPPLLVAVLTAAACLPPAVAWQRWTDESVFSPGPRDGHTLSVFNSSLFLFGGRSNEPTVQHIPRTFEIQKVNGSLSFKTYDGKPVKPCVNMTVEQCYTIQTGEFHNDVWRYPLECAHGWDTGCVDGAGWTIVEPGAPLGGCQVRNEKEVCSHPTERYSHVSATFDDGRLVIYGGYSELCEDYCSDIWALHLPSCLPYTRDANGTVIGDASTVAAAGAGCKWEMVEHLQRNRPGKRWRSASAYNATSGVWAMFGGHRLWHGFAPGNSVGNRWSDVTKLDPGGFLDDLWIMRYDGTTSSLASTGATTNNASAAAVAAPGRGGWQQAIPQESCYAAPPSLDYNDRYDVVCTVHWPSPRASAALGMIGTSLFLHGGYTVTYPYPQVLGRGAGPGTASIAVDGDTPTPTLPYYLSDLWRYDMESGLWTQLTPVSPTQPMARYGHTIVVQSAILVLHGGYASGGNFLADTWLYNTASGWWVPKDTHVHPLLPDTCTSDVVVDPATGDEIAVSNSVVGEATRFTLLDGNNGRSRVPVLIPQPRRRAPGWDGCRDRADGREDLPAQLQWVQPSQRAGHAAAVAVSSAIDPTNPAAGAIFMYGGEGPPFEVDFSMQVNHAGVSLGDLWYLDLNHCPGNCSLHGVCQYGFCICQDGWYGLDCSNATCPGDLCYYNADNFQSTCLHCSSLPHVHILADMLTDPAINKKEAYRLVFGKELGQGLFDPAVLPQDLYTAIARKVRIDLPQLATSDARTRMLFDGYAGGINLTEGAALAAAARIRHGVCDGFGQCQCAPPFLGDDCSVRDCPNACSGQGWCSVEYPVARCICTPPWSGPDCATYLCPNNCSYPNGACNNGVCECGWMQNPYNKSQNFVRYAGDDCSFQQPFAAAQGSGLTRWQAVGLAGLVLAALVHVTGCRRPDDD